VQEAFNALGWEPVAAGPHDGALRAVVTTPLWRFHDDVTVRVMPREGGGAGLAVRSASRVGRGDLGANTRHVLDLRREVARVLGVGDGPTSEAEPGCALPPCGGERRAGRRG
jgi:hypothetical protein